MSRLRLALLGAPFLIGALVLVASLAISFAAGPGGPVTTQESLVAAFLRASPGFAALLVLLAGAVAVIRDDRPAAAVLGAALALAGACVALGTGVREAMGEAEIGPGWLLSPDGLIRIGLVWAALWWLGAALGARRRQRALAAPEVDPAQPPRRFPLARLLFVAAVPVSGAALLSTFMGVSFEVYESAPMMAATVRDLRQGADGPEVTVVWDQQTGEEYVRSEITRDGRDLHIRFLVGAYGDVSVWNMFITAEQAVPLGPLEPGEYRIRVNDWEPVTLTLPDHPTPLSQVRDVRDPRLWGTSGVGDLLDGPTGATLSLGWPREAEETVEDLTPYGQDNDLEILFMTRQPGESDVAPTPGRPWHEERTDLEIGDLGGGDYRIRVARWDPVIRELRPRSSADDPQGPAGLADIPVSDLRHGVDGPELVVAWQRRTGEHFVRADVTRSGDEIVIRFLTSRPAGADAADAGRPARTTVLLPRLPAGSYQIRVNDADPVALELPSLPPFEVRDARPPSRYGGGIAGMSRRDDGAVELVVLWPAIEGETLSRVAVSSDPFDGFGSIHVRILTRQPTGPLDPWAEWTTREERVSLGRLQPGLYRVAIPGWEEYSFTVGDDGSLDAPEAPLTQRTG